MNISHTLGLNKIISVVSLFKASIVLLEEHCLAWVCSLPYQMVLLLRFSLGLAV